MDAMRIIAIDLDGTLLSPDLSIHEEDMQAMKQAQQQNEVVAIATGRALFDVQYILQPHHFTCPVIASNGAEIYVDEKKVHEQGIPSELVQEMIPWMNQRQIYYQLYLPERIIVLDQGLSFLKQQLDWTHPQNLDLDAALFWETIRPQTCQYGLQEVTDVTPVIEKDSIIKIMVISPDLRILQQVKEHLHLMHPCSISSSAVFNLEIMAHGVDKGTALQKLCNHYGISIKDTVVIGDSLNDISMFQIAGIRIAMGNAHEHLLKLATFQTLSHMERGVAYAFRHYLTFGNS
jgi:5-amino-6-(5-phospho-D-ribitylamino)uracil phosphatase